MARREWRTGRRGLSLRPPRRMSVMNASLVAPPSPIAIIALVFLPRFGGSSTPAQADPALQASPQPTVQESIPPTAHDVDEGSVAASNALDAEDGAIVVTTERRGNDPAGTRHRNID